MLKATYVALSNNVNIKPKKAPTDAITVTIPKAIPRTFGHKNSSIKNDQTAKNPCVNFFKMFNNLPICLVS